MTLFLAFKPGIELLFMADTSEQSCCIDTCSADELEAETEDDCHDKDCEGNFCNPFHTCSSCFVLCQNLPTTQTLPLTIAPQQQFNYQLNASALFKHEFWQPPELV